MSKLSVGIVGLPNVGKSTLFNALLQKQQAFAANFPFATIEPNIGVVPVPDSRLKDLQKIVAGSPPIVPATIEFVDIAGLIAGAHKGEGLGNKFLAHIREVNAICYLLRAFKDENIIREGSIHPKDDLETLKTELDLADLESVERRESKKNKTAEELPLLKDKPTLIVLNVDEEDLKIAEQIESNFAKEIGTDKNQVVAISAKLEEELAALHPSESAIYLNELGIKKTGLERLINKAFATLGLITFLTAGEKPARQSPDGSRRLAGGFNSLTVNSSNLHFEISIPVVKPDALKQILVNLKSLLAQHPGETPVVLLLQNGSVDPTRVPLQLKVANSSTLESKLIGLSF